MDDVESTPEFEPLRAMDRQFLAMEDANAHMHVSGYSVYEVGSLRSEAGGVDFQTFRKAIESALDRIPRYRQKLLYTPIEAHPVWVDDERFDLDDHLKHLRLPSPGNLRQLDEMVGWIVSQPLDHSRPLWEMWVVEGVDEEKSFAVVTKMHHCMIDGGAGVNLMQLLLRAEPVREVREAKPFKPRPAPGPAELAAWEVMQRVRTPFRLFGGLLDFASQGQKAIPKLGERVGALGELLQNVLPATRTPISGNPLGPRRRVSGLQMELEEVASLRRSLGCTLNDLVLAMVAGAVRRFLQRRRVELDGLDFRVSIPVNVRRESESEEMGNRVSTWIVPLPLAEPDPLEQLVAIVEQTSRLKRSNQAVAIEMVMSVAEEVPALLSLSARAMQGQVSMIVTNVPGPPIPLYLLGCRTLCMQPLVPLMPGVGIGVALLSYDGTLHWGLQADYDRVPDLQLFVEDLEAARRAIEQAVAGHRRHGTE